MLSRDLLPLERAVYRAAREQLSSDNQAEQTGIDAEQRDHAAAAVIGPIIDDPALYGLMPERHSDQSGRIYDDAYQDVLRAVINDLYLFVQQKKPLNQRLFLFRHKKRRPPFVDGRLC